MPARQVVSARVRPAQAVALDAKLRRIFVAYCSYGDVENVTHMSSAKITKFAREAQLFDANISSADLDLMFVRATQSPAGGAPAAGGGRARVGRATRPPWPAWGVEPACNG